MNRRQTFRGTDQQFGYSPFTNKQIHFATINSSTVNNYTLSNRYFTRDWRVHIFNSCTSALMQLILQYGVHLGDAGGFGPRDEIGYFISRSEYGKAKRKRTALLGDPHAEGYIYPGATGLCRRRAKACSGRSSQTRRRVAYPRINDFVVSARVLGAPHPLNIVLLLGAAVQLHR